MDCALTSHDAADQGLEAEVTDPLRRPLSAKTGTATAQTELGGVAGVDGSESGDAEANELLLGQCTRRLAAPGPKSGKQVVNVLDSGRLRWRFFEMMTVWNKDHYAMGSCTVLWVFPHGRWQSKRATAGTGDGRFLLQSWYIDGGRDVSRSSIVTAGRYGGQRSWQVDLLW